MSRVRKVLERVYRSWLGHGLYYLIELWLRLIAIPSTRWAQILRPAQRFDISLVASVAVVWGATAAVLSAHIGRNPLWAVFCGEVLPFLTLCQIFGWGLYLQHTHPRTGFYPDRSSWEFFRAQSANSTHVEFPKVFDKLFHGFFDHTAHHLDVKVPFYRLTQVECELDRMLRGKNVVVHWSWKEFFHTMRVCKLYDYELHCWTDFEGRPTAYVEGRGSV